jgi:hypothetical protein
LKTAKKNPAGKGGGCHSIASGENTFSQRRGSDVSSKDTFTGEIQPFIGVGAVHFGQPRSEVLTLMGTPSKSFRKVPFATTDTDAFAAAGLHIYYDAEYRVECVEAVQPSTVSFGGIYFLNRRVVDVAREMSEVGYKGADLTYDDLGISLYDEDGIVTCVTVVPRGYHDLSDPNSPASLAKAAAAAWCKARFD